MSQPAFPNPVSEALRRITMAHQILDEVVTSSETFDYRKAKQALQDLQKMIRELGREEARLRSELNAGVEAQVLPFPLTPADSTAPR